MGLWHIIHPLMRSKVKLGARSKTLTAIVAVVLLATFCYAEIPFAKYLVAGVFIVLCLTALLYMPLSISVENGTLNINRPLRVKSIPLSSIESVKLFAPTKAGKRLCGSGGWFGYYGWFHEPSIGRYFAYYGNASDCFLVRLTDGKKYLLGCENPKEIVDALNQHLS